MRISTRCHLLVVCWLLATSGGCQSPLRRAKWHSFVVMRPQVGCATGGSQMAVAERAYARAVELESCGDAACVDHFFLAATAAWPDVETQLAARGTSCGRSDAVYRSSLAGLVRAGTRFRRLDPARGLAVRTAAGETTIPVAYRGFHWQPEDFDQLMPVGEYSTRELTNSYRCRGLGVALVAFHCRRPHETFRRPQQAFAATLLLRPASGSVASPACPFVLEMSDPLRVTSTVVAGREVPLQRDLTAPIAYLLSKSGRASLTRFLQPGSTTEETGLFMLEPYQPGKIPVIFVHGLLSDPFTWANMANEIRARPALLERFQFWGYEYATGEPFLRSAAVLRRQLHEVQAQFDPTASEETLRKIVLIGHSMGGLVSKLQVTHSGNLLWQSVCRCPLESIVTPSSTRAQLAKAFFFSPSAIVSRVVFIGTPHRGSPWARRPIGRLGSKLVNEPSSMQGQHRQLICDNRDIFSREFTRRIPTSIDLLRPDSPLLCAIDSLPLDGRVELHTIAGSGFPMLGAGDSDRVVPLSSALQPGVVTEKRIHAKHDDLHKSAAGIAELFCILQRHLIEFDAEIARETGSLGADTNHRSDAQEPCYDPAQ